MMNSNLDYMEEKMNNILDKYIAEIFDEKIWENKELGQIAEVTYSYEFDQTLDNNNINYERIKNAIFFNSTLFTSIGGVKYEEWIQKSENDRLLELKQVGKTIEMILKKKIQLIQKSIRELKDINYNKDKLLITKNDLNNNKIFELRKELFIGSLESNLLLLKQCLIGLPFELEKAGLKHNLTKKEITKKIKELDKYDELLFGGKIFKDNNYEEIIKCYQYLKTKYDENNSNTDIQKYLQKIEDLLPESYIYSKYNEPEKVTLESINTKNNIKEYVQTFNQYLSGTNIDYKAEIDSSVGSMTDTPTSLKIPNTNKTKELDLEMIIRLIAHEFTSHTKNLINGKKLLGNFRGAKNIEKEEGLAMISESLFLYGKNFYKKDLNGKIFIDKDKINISSYHPKTLLGEILDGKDLLDFLIKYENIEGDNTTPLRRFIRLKRLRPFNQKGVQHKDTTYIRGQFKVADYLNSHKNPENLYLGKVGINDVDKLVEIKKLLEENGEKLNLSKPTLTYEYIYFKLLQKNNPKKYKKIKYETYLTEKYPLFKFKFSEKPNFIKDKTKLNIILILNQLNINIKKHTSTQKIIGQKKYIEKIKNDLKKGIYSKNI